MGSRFRLAAVLVAVAAGAAAGSASSQPQVETAIYTVRGDPRLCPSPLCGGYLVALANGARTRCVDGLRHPRCYVARAVDATGNPLGSIVEGALVRGAIGAGHDDLGELAVSALFPPAGQAAVSGGYYRVVDTGIGCVRAPCFSYRATQVNGRTRTTMSSVDLRAARGAPDEVARAASALRTTNGLLAQGRFASTPDGGRVFRATRLFLRAPLPRA